MKRKIVSAALGAAMVFSLAAASFAQVNAQRMKEVLVTGTDYKFSPTDITAAPGQKIMVTLVNKGKRPHNIEFDLPGKKVKLERDLKAGETGSLTFTAPPPGTYSFICPVGMHATMGMKGRLVVTQE